MFWSHGVGYWSYVGIHWDGQGRAGIGVYHNSDTLYESDIEHKVERFTGFTLAAISMSLDRPDFQGASPMATSEVYYRNNLIEGSKVGILLNYFVS